MTSATIVPSEVRACVDSVIASPTGESSAHAQRKPSPEVWDRFVLEHKEGTLFHMSAWAAAVEDTFRHEAILLSARKGDRLVGALPMCLVDSLLGGRMLVSMPYAVGGGVLADDRRVALALFEQAKQIAAQRKCTSIDLRSENAAIAELPVVEGYAGFRRELPSEVSQVLPSLPRKARAAARNARDKYGLSVSFDDGHLPAVWRLYTQSMRRLGSIGYPFRFFKNLIAYTPNQHWVCLVTSNGKPVAGLVTFLFRDTVMPYFVGTNRLARQCNAANFVYLSVMERGVEQGYRVFDFGRSRCDNAGSYNFKRFHGFAPRPLEYQRYCPNGQSGRGLSPTATRYKLARRVWPYLPLAVTRTLGGYLSKHIPG